MPVYIDTIQENVKVIENIKEVPVDKIVVQEVEKIVEVPVEVCLLMCNLAADCCTPDAWLAAHGPSFCGLVMRSMQDSLP